MQAVEAPTAAADVRALAGSSSDQLETAAAEEEDMVGVDFALDAGLPVEKTREEVLQEKLSALKHFSFPTLTDPNADQTGATAFLAACRQQQLNTPTSSITKELMRASDSLDLSHCGLGRKGCAALAAALRVNSTFSTVMLGGNSITPLGALDIVRAINEDHAVVVVDFSSNRIGEAEITTESISGVKGGAVIAELLGADSTVTDLSLRDSGIGDEDVTLFSNILAENVNLQRLDLSYNRIGYLGAAALAKMLSRNGDLRDINLEWNRFGVAGSHLLLSEGFLLNNTVKVLNMSSCGLDDKCAELIARIVSENAIEEITVANNRIGKGGAPFIAKSLPQASVLTALVLDGNPLGDEGCEAILSALNSCDIKTLKLLSMQHCGCSTDIEKLGATTSNTTTCIRISES